MARHDNGDTNSPVLHFQTWPTARSEKTQLRLQTRTRSLNPDDGKSQGEDSLVTGVGEVREEILPLAARARTEELSVVFGRGNPRHTKPWH